MSMTTGARSGPAADINVTPLIDVLLVLLIIFMVILPQHSLGELAQIPQPNPDNRVMSPETPVVIQLKDAGQRPDLTINQKQVKWADLEASLQAIYRAREDHVAFLKGDPEIDFTFVAEAVDISHRAGAVRIGLMGQKD